MKQQQWKAGLIVALLVAMAGSVALAGAGATAPAPAKQPAQAAPAPAKEPAQAAVAPAKEPAKAPAAAEPKEDPFGFFHKPFPWFQMGGDFRFRIEAGENWLTLNDDARKKDNLYNQSDHTWNYERYRTRWWTKSTLGDDITLNTRLTWETRTWNEPADKVQRADIGSGDPRNPLVREWNADEALFDWFNVNIRNIAGMPLTATVGRQDLLGFGVGWLILDGTPLDGSRTLYFDAARFTYGNKDSDNVLDLIYIDQSAQSDRWLKPINDQDRAVIIQDERAAVLYLTNKSLKPTQLEGFFVYKNDNPIDRPDSLTPVTNIPAAASAPAFSAWSRKAEIYTLGGAVSGTPEEHWKYRAEGAYQTGHRDDSSGNGHDAEAFGALSNLEYAFKDSLDNSLHTGYEYDSGDKPGTDTDEQFDLLWGKWPRWSELLIYTSTNETDPANLTNLHRFNVGHRIQLCKQCSVSTDYHLLWADHTAEPWRSTDPTIHVSGRSKFRGQLVTCWLRYQFSKQLSSHVMAEYFIPGSYFEKPSDDEAYFLRLNVEYIF